MRKRYVLQSVPCPPPENYGGVRISDGWYCSPRFAYTVAKAQLVYGDAAQDSLVLNIDLYRSGELKARYFADKFAGSHRCMILRTGEWKQLTLQNVSNVTAGMRPNHSEYNYYSDFERWEYDTDEDKACAHGYLGVDIAYWESDLQREKRYKQLNNKQARINALMEEEVPPIPQDFYRWMHEDIFGQRHLFQKKCRKMIRMKCTACGAEWNRKKAFGVGMKTCPKCGKTVRATYKKEEKSGEKSLYLLQPCRTGGRWIERYFRARCRWNPEATSQVTISELIRVIVPYKGTWGTCYYEDGPDRKGNILFWDANHTNRHMTSGYLYPGTLQQVRDLWPEALMHSGIDILTARGIKFNVNNLIIMSVNAPYIEYIVKGGFYRLAVEMIKNRGYTDSAKVNRESMSPQEAFRLSADRVNRLRQMDGGDTVLSWLQYEQMTGRKISQSNLKELDAHGIKCGDPDVWKALSYVKSAEMFANYIRKQAKLGGCSRRQVISDWIDYLDMAKKQKLNLSHEMFYKPKNLKTAHDACVRNAQQEELQRKADGILKRFPDVEKILRSIREKYAYDGREYSIVVPAGIADIIHEGRALGHCIDTTDRYFDRIQNHITYLVFLRRRDQKDVPYYTLEIEPGGTIRQQRTTGNNQNKADVKAYSSFIHEWQRVVRDRISEEDRQLAEISRQTRIREYQELRDKQEKVWRGALAGKLLVDVLEADLIEVV